MALFEIVVIHRPFCKKDEPPIPEKIVVPLKLYVARDERAAALGATLEHANDLAKLPSAELEVLVRPF